jgi:hypothetical protein
MIRSFSLLLATIQYSRALFLLQLQRAKSLYSCIIIRICVTTYKNKIFYYLLEWLLYLIDFQILIFNLCASW